MYSLYFNNKFKKQRKKETLKNSKESEELDGKQRSTTCIKGIFKEENQSKNKEKSTKNYNSRKCYQ